MNRIRKVNNDEALEEFQNLVFFEGFVPKTQTMFVRALVPLKLFAVVDLMDAQMK